jgi:membrane protein
MAGSARTRSAKKILSAMNDQHEIIKKGSVWQVLKKSAIRLGKNNPVHLAGATSFLATFSIAPIFVVIVHALGSVIGREEIKDKLIEKVAEDAPKETVDQMRQFIDGFQRLWGDWYVDVAVFLFLIFSASKLFILIRSSFYQIWRLKHIKDVKAKISIRNYLFPVVLIISAGVLLMAGVMGQSLQYVLGDAVSEISVTASKYFSSVYRYFISLLVAWVWFAVVFRYLTDARPPWPTVWIGAFFTSVLYNVGKLILQPALSVGKIHQVFGTSASLVMLQLFIFYISLLIYYGAAFTFEWAKYKGQKVHIPDYLGFYTIEEKHTSEDPETD